MRPHKMNQIAKSPNRFLCDNVSFNLGNKNNRTVARQSPKFPSGAWGVGREGYHDYVPPSLDSPTLIRRWLYLANEWCQLIVPMLVRRRTRTVSDAMLLLTMHLPNPGRDIAAGATRTRPLEGSQDLPSLLRLRPDFARNIRHVAAYKRALRLSPSLDTALACPRSP